MAERDKNGRWQKGQSPNPAGRPRGSGNSIGVRLRRQIEKDAPDLVKTLVKKAKEGDAETARWLVDRLIPRLRPESAPVAIDLAGAEKEVADRLLAAVAEGEVSSQTAAELMTLVRGATPDEQARPMDRAHLDAIYERAMQNMEREQKRIEDDIASGKRPGDPNAEPVSRH